MGHVWPQAQMHTASSGCDRQSGSLHAKLQELIDAPAMPWSERDLGVWSAMWPQMSRWLPDEERTALIAAFDAQIERLTAN